MTLQEDAPRLLHGSVHPGACCMHLEGLRCLFTSQVLVHLYEAKEYTLFSSPLSHLFLQRNQKYPTASMVFLCSL